jgi:hypothetical protein
MGAKIDEDAEGFLEQVDEISRLVEGLKEGTISPEYIDSKLKFKQEKEAEKAAAKPKGALPAPGGAQAAARGPTASNPANGPAGGPASTAGTPDTEEDDAEAKAEAEAEAEEQRREQAMAKVKELMANRERKLKARARYEEYVKTKDSSRFGTDYNKWDIWCPEDEEDDVFNSLGPNTPQFRAMEKDIDDRHKA